MHDKDITCYLYTGLWTVNLEKRRKEFSETKAHSIK